MKYVLGIDQGGSKTHAIVADENGRILGLGKSYGAVHSTNGLEYAVKAILEASKEALNAAGLQQEDIAAVVGGLTGIDWDYEAAILEKALQEQFPNASVKAVNDCIIAMKAATQKKQCGILCAGSGLNCAVENGEDCFVYGFYIPDEHQGGWSLGKVAVQAVFDSHIGFLEETTLTERLLEFFKVDTVDELLFMQVKGKIEASDYLRIPPILQEEACSGDKVAADIWIHYGRTIAKYITARITKEEMCQADMDIVLSGSIFKCKFQEFQNVVKEEILQKVPNANIIAAEYEPIFGAAVMGLNLLHGEMSEEIYNNMKESSKNYPLHRLEK